MKVFSYIRNRAKAFLIHEFLNLKYLGKERKVRELEEIFKNVQL